MLQPIIGSRSRNAILFTEQDSPFLDCPMKIVLLVVVQDRNEIMLQRSRWEQFPKYFKALLIAEYSNANLRWLKKLFCLVAG